MEETRFELDGHVEDHENDEEIEIEEAKRGSGIYILLALFIILFLNSASLFLYFQCYIGQGKWDFTFQKQTHLSEKSAQNQEAEIKVLMTKMDSLENALSIVSNKYQEGTPLFSMNDSGETFEVQIGFFRSFDFNRYDSLLVNMNVEERNGAYKLMIGRFNNFDDACALRRDMIDMGIDGAFVVKKLNGVRESFDEKCP